jgi:hypothetical protein
MRSRGSRDESRGLDEERGVGWRLGSRLLITEDEWRRLLLVLLLIIGENFESSEDFKVFFVIGDDR